MPDFGGTEVPRAALDHGFETLGLELMVAMTLGDNHASQAVMRRIGPGYRKWFDINRGEWTRK